MIVSPRVHHSLDILHSRCQGFEEIGIREKQLRTNSIDHVVRSLVSYNRCRLSSLCTESEFNFPCFNSQICMVQQANYTNTQVVPLLIYCNSHFLPLILHSQDLVSQCTRVSCIQLFCYIKSGTIFHVRKYQCLPHKDFKGTCKRKFKMWASYVPNALFVFRTTKHRASIMM